MKRILLLIILMIISLGLLTLNATEVKCKTKQSFAMDEDLKKDKDFLLQIKQLLYKNRETVLKLIEDKEARAEGIDNYLEENGFQLGDFNISSKLKKDKEFALKVLEKKGALLEYFDDTLI